MMAVASYAMEIAGVTDVDTATWTVTETPTAVIPVTSYMEIRITIIALALYALTGILIIACNTLNLYILRKPLECFSDNTRFFLRALAAVDLLTGLVCCPTEMILAVYGNWPLGHVTCDIVAIVYTMVCCQALLCLCCVSVDRFLTIVKPLHYPTIMTPMRARLFLASALVVGALASLVMLVARELPSPEPEQKLCALLYLDSPVAIKPVLVIVFVSFFVPASVLLFVNIRLMVITIQKTRELADMSPTAVRYTTDRLKGVRTILVLTSAFFVTWLPVIVTIICKVVFNVHIPPALGSLVSVPALCNSWVNAVIYLFMSRSYRRAIVREIQKCFKRRHEKWVTNGSLGASAALNSEAIL
ncbi:5-hydroxytryptamine receptor 6-like [Diadema antillarum]|uniref:5-hydroxytryptamine receptor 6-like n=1 Tax=Diadema antillarum TaxID=105358 RepID=UPI003A8B13D5